MRFPGIIPAVVVPFTDDDQIDVAALRDNVAFLLDERRRRARRQRDDGRGRQPVRWRSARSCCDTVVELAAGRVPVIAGVSAGTTARRRAPTRRRPRGRRRAGRHVPAAAATTAARREEIVAFYAAVADAAELPVMAYNNPEASGHRPARPQLIAQIAAAGRRRRRGQGVLAATRAASPRCSARPSSRCSSAATTGRSRASPRGATGWVSGVANIAPARVRRAAATHVARRPARRGARDLPAAAAARAGST